jgi:hypothetical protein
VNLAKSFLFEIILLGGENEKILFMCSIFFCFQFFSLFKRKYSIFWSFGDIGASFDNLTNRFEPFPFINVGNINWITTHGFGFGFHIFNIEGTESWQQSLVLPIEISYSPFGDNEKYLFLTFYGRGGWMINFNSNDEKSFSERNGFFGAAGLRASWFPTLGNYRAVFTGAFIEYTTKNELRMGISVDTSVIVALATIAIGIALSPSDNDKDRDDNKRYGRRK